MAQNLTAKRNTKALVPRAPKTSASANEVAYKDKFDSYVIFEILKQDGSRELVRLDGYTAKTSDGKTVNNYSFTKPFETAPNLGSLATMAGSLASSLLRGNNDLKDKINGVIETVTKLPGIGDIATLDVLLTDMTYKQNVQEDGKLVSYLQFGLGFSPPGGWTVGGVKLTGFGFKYTHTLSPD